MADDDDGKDKGSDGKDKGERPPRKVAHPFSHYLKLAGTLLVTLFVFMLLSRGLAGCQDKNPFTGEPIPPPPPPPAGQ